MFSPGSSLGRYRLDNVLGRGGMGTVCLAYDTELHRPVAVKIIGGDGASRTKVLQEARSAAALNHPNICTIFEVGEADGSPFIAMEYLDGRSLRERIDCGSLSNEETLRFGLQTAEALAYAHEHGVIVLAGGYDEGIAHLLSQVYGLLHDSAEASKWLEQALEAGYLDYPEIMRDPCYRTIRSEPKFASVVAALRRRWEAFEP